MANQTFVDFDLRTQLLSGDYLVGYKEDGTAELRTKVSDIINLVPRANLTDIQSNSGNWQNTYSTVRSLSTTWAIDDTANLAEIASASGKWNSSFTSVNSNSANWTGVATTVRAPSGSWNSTYTSVNANSANWSNTTSTVRSNSADWKHANRYLPLSGGVLTGFVTITGNNGQGTNLRIIDGLSIGYSAGDFGPTNDGAELYMDYSAGPDQGVFYFTTRDNGEEPIVFRQRHDWTAPSYQFEPLIIGSNHTVGINAPTGTRSFGSPLTVYGNISASGALYSTVLSTATIQTIYEGTKINLSISNSLTATQVRVGRLSMLDVNYGTNSVLKLSETSTNTFKPGDVVGIAGRQIFPTPTTARLRIIYEKLGQTPVYVTDLLGGYGYNEGAVALVYDGNVFTIQPFDNHNIKSITQELRVESIQANDPGTPFNTIGRGTFVHGLTLNGGDIKFTNGSDHFHLIHNGTGGNWQTLNGGYNWTPQRITQHTLAFRGGELQIDIVAANGSSLTGNHVQAPYGVFPNISSNYLALWTASEHPALDVNKIVYFSVSPTGPTNESLRYIGFTAASYPAKIISVNNIGSANSNADIPSGQTLPANAVKHYRLQPVNLTKDNWNGAALIDTNGNFQSSTSPAFTNSVLNAGEIIRVPETALLVPDIQKVALSAFGGYNRVSMRNGCELVFDLTSSPLLSSTLPFLYEGLPILVLLSSITTLTATNYGGLTPNSAKCQYGLPVETAAGSTQGEFTGGEGGYQQQTYDGYIYRSTPTQVIIRLGQNRGTEESRMQKHASPNVDLFVNRPGYGITPSTYNRFLPPGGESAVPYNGYRLNGVGANNRIGTWANCNTGQVYSMPPIIKSGIEFSSFPPISSSDLQLFVYAGNKDPVHRPVAGMQLFAYERYPNIQSELKETGAIVSKFCLGPSCEGFDRDTAAIGFGSTAYHYRSIAIGHRVETLSAEEVVLGVDNSTLRIGNSAITVSPAMLSSNGVDTFLKVRNSNDNIMYGLKLQVIG
jgi:hypothetical protein